MYAFFHFSEEEMQKYQISMSKNASDMENHLFMKAKSKVNEFSFANKIKSFLTCIHHNISLFQEEYLAFIAKLIIHISQSKKPAGAMTPGANNTNIGVQQGMPDPIGALQTMARQGTGNNTNMGMQTPVQNPQMILQQTQGVNVNANPSRKSILFVKFEFL